MSRAMITREQWLNDALALIRERAASCGFTVPADARVSVGFPGGGSARKRIGECWTRAQSSIGVNEMFISPVVREPAEMLAVLVHEAIHASDDCASGHTGHFRQAATAIGLVGKMTATTAGDELRAWLQEIIGNVLPAMDHGTLSLTGRKKQGTRMLKFECSACECVIRASAKWADLMHDARCGCGEYFRAA
jgi:hypothetical protein